MITCDSGKTPGRTGGGIVLQTEVQVEIVWQAEAGEVAAAYWGG